MRDKNAAKDSIINQLRTALANAARTIAEYEQEGSEEEEEEEVEEEEEEEEDL